jgi:hypothetical protein
MHMYKHHSTICNTNGIGVTKVIHLWKQFVPTDSPCDFMEFLDLRRPNQVTDPRDRVFAYLGHPSALSGSNKSLLIRPSYAKSTASVYHELAVCVLKNTNSLITLNCVQRGSSPTGKQYSSHGSKLRRVTNLSRNFITFLGSRLGLFHWQRRI